MKRTVKKNQDLSVWVLLLASIFATSCHGQKSSEPIAAATMGSIYKQTPQILYGPMPSPKAQISQYICSMFQDKQGNIWLGTNGDGVCRFDGKKYTYFSPTDLSSGFCGNAVRGIVQQANGNIWFATDNGVSRYNGKSFTNFKVADGLANNQVWSILKDKSGNLWFGTQGGVSRYDGKSFTNFALPATDISAFPMAYCAPKLVNSIIEDKKGNIWFGSNGGGAYRYDGRSLVAFTEKDGLCNNFVQCVFEDHSGDLWFGTRFGGLSRYDGKSFTTFTQQNGLGNDFVWTMLQDKAGNIWVGNAGGGLSRYNQKRFTHYSSQDGLRNQHVQSLLEDQNGKLWIGTSGGAFQFDGKTFTNITRVADRGC